MVWRSLLLLLLLGLLLVSVAIVVFLFFIVVFLCNVKFVQFYVMLGNLVCIKIATLSLVFCVLSSNHEMSHSWGLNKEEGMKVKNEVKIEAFYFRIFTSMNVKLNH